MERNKPSSIPKIPSVVFSAAQLPMQRGRSFFSASCLVALAPCAFTVLVMMLSSCSSSLPPSKRSAPAVKRTAPSPVVRPMLPEGWADITSRSKQPQIIQWIVNREYSATMVLRELQTDSATFKELTNEGLNVVAEISLRSKVPQDNADLRVTRVPAMVEGKRRISAYVYSERGLLRRVAVFAKQNRFMELELMQEQSSAKFDQLSDALLEFAGMVQDR